MIAKNRTCHHQVDLVLGMTPGQVSEIASALDAAHNIAGNSHQDIRDALAASSGNFQGDYSSTDTYKTGDIVEHANRFWLYVDSTTRSANHDPFIQADYWDQLSSAVTLQPQPDNVADNIRYRKDDLVRIQQKVYLCISTPSDAIAFSGIPASTDFIELTGATGGLVSPSITAILTGSAHAALSVSHTVTDWREYPALGISYHDASDTAVPNYYLEVNTRVLDTVGNISVAVEKRAQLQITRTANSDALVCAFQAAGSDIDPATGDTLSFFGLNNGTGAVGPIGPPGTVDISDYSGTANYSLGDLAILNNELYEYVSATERSTNHSPVAHPSYWINHTHLVGIINLDNSTSIRIRRGMVIILTSDDSVYLSTSNSDATTLRNAAYIRTNAGLGGLFIQLKGSVIEADLDADLIAKIEEVQIPDWSVGTHYQIGELVKVGTQTYQALQGHTASISNGPTLSGGANRWNELYNFQRVDSEPAGDAPAGTIVWWPE